MAAKLAVDNTVYGAARFRTRRRGSPTRQSGSRRCAPTSATLDFAELPDVSEVDYVLNFAVARSNDWDADFAANVEGAASAHGALRGRRRVLPVLHRRRVRVAGAHVAHRGGAARRQPPRRRDGHVLDQQDRGRGAGATHRAAVEHPTVIARLSVPYGDTFGWQMFQLMMIEHGMAMQVSERPSHHLLAAAPRRHRGVAPLPAGGGVGACDRRQLGWRREWWRSRSGPRTSPSSWQAPRSRSSRARARSRRSRST